MSTTDTAAPPSTTTPATGSTPPPDAPQEPQAPAAAAPEAPKPTDPPKAPTNPWEDPAAAEAEIKRLRQENGAARTNAKAQAAEEARKELAQTIGKALGLVEDEQIDPAALTEQLTKSQTDAKQARVELAVYRSATDAGGDPAALLDSTSFLASLDGIDPSDSAAVAEAIKKAVEANPRLGAASSDPRVPAPNPGQGASETPPGVAQLSEAEVKKLYAEKKYDEIEKARSEGRLTSLLGA